LLEGLFGSLVCFLLDFSELFALYLLPPLHLELVREHQMPQATQLLTPEATTEDEQ
jgi:hypothetical protein